MKKILCFFLVLSFFAGSLFAEEAGVKEEEKISPEKLISIAEKYTSSVVVIEYWLKYDKGETQQGSESLVREERPFEISGFLIDRKKVMAPDVVFNPRFVDKITVSYRGKRVDAVVHSYMLDHDAFILELTSSLEGAMPLSFKSGDVNEGFMLEYEKESGEFVVKISPFSPQPEIDNRNTAMLSVKMPALLLDKNGDAVTLIMNDKVNFNSNWKEPPLKWLAVSQKDLSKKEKELLNIIENNFFRTTLIFRSPKIPASNQMSIRYDRNGDTSETEKNSISFLLPGNQLIVLEKLAPRVTARLENIIVHLSDGTTVNAEFKNTLSDWGAFIASPEKELPVSNRFSETSLYGKLDHLFLSAQIKIQGEEKIVYIQRNRIGDYYQGWKNRLYPFLDGNDENTFLFDYQLKLISLPVMQRNNSLLSRYSYEEERARIIPAEFLAASLHGLPQSADKENVPLKEEDENRLAWMGVELQALTPDLAKVNNVSEYTRNGETGGIVSYVYAGSPADRAGIKPGFILLRLNIEDMAKPVNINVDESFGSEPFPWDDYEMIPPEYMSNLPLPWPSAENGLNTLLTDIGINKKYTAVFYDNKSIVTKDMVIEKMPPHYSAAKEYNNENLGLNVRNITYEVRRYFQMKDNSPGIIVSRSKPGLPAAVAGIKSYEIITHVGGVPVNNIDEFEKLVADKKELKLNITRMVHKRVVRINL